MVKSISHSKHSTSSEQLEQSADKKSLNASSILDDKSEENNLITFSDVTYSLPDGIYAATVSQSRIIKKGATRRWLLGFMLNGRSTEFVSIFQLPLNKSSAFGCEVYDACGDIEKLTPDVLLDHQAIFKIHNKIANGREYSNIIQFAFNDEAEET